MGNETFAWFLRDLHLHDSEQVILSLPLATMVQDRWQEATMIQRAYFLHYRLVREGITAVVTLGTAMLVSYLILWARL